MNAQFRPLKLYDFHGKLRMYNIHVFHNNKMKVVVDLFCKEKPLDQIETIEDVLEQYDVKFDDGSTAKMTDCEFIENIDVYKSVVKTLEKSNSNA